MQFDGPIPGQSLTSTPRNYPWERPPETSDPDEAITHYLTRIGQPKTLDNILDAVSGGLPVSMITDLMLTGGVAKGLHSIDISLMIAPVVHNYIVNLLEEENVEFKEFFDENSDEDIRKTMAVTKAISGVRETLDKPVEKELVATKEVEPGVEPEVKSKRGLMSREVE